MQVEILLTALNAVMPVVLLILLGYVLRQKNFLTDDFIRVGNKVVFRIALPCTLFVNVYGIADASRIPWDTVLYCGAALTVLFLLSMAVAVLTTRIPQRRGVIWQCCFRSNFAIIGLTMAESLGGSEAAAVAAVVSALAVPLFNIFGVIALEVFVEDDQGKRHSPGRILLDILKNPLIIAVLAGLLCILARAVQQSLWGEVVFSLSRDTKFLYSAAGSLKALATPLALLVMGGQFRFSMMGGMLKEITVASVFRVVIAPLLGLGGAIVLDRFTGLVHCTQQTVPAMLCLFGAPVAVSSAIMAGQMHNDEQLATQLVVWTSVASMFTVFGFSCALMAMGYIAV